ncbi:hypothetical protein GCM10027073_60580 [Streptomyces chlorus]
MADSRLARRLQRCTQGQRMLVVGRSACLTPGYEPGRTLRGPMPFSEFVEVYCITGQLITAILTFLNGRRGGGS